jgi:hypothetical protein
LVVSQEMTRLLSVSLSLSPHKTTPPVGYSSLASCRLNYREEVFVAGFVTLSEQRTPFYLLPVDRLQPILQETIAALSTVFSFSVGHLESAGARQRGAER